MSKNWKEILGVVVHEFFSFLKKGWEDVLGTLEDALSLLLVLGRC